MKKVMLADDEQNVRIALERLIPWEKLECEVVYVAKSGSDVLEHIEEFQPDILVLDIRMPGVDGMEVARRIREKGWSVAIIFLTAHAEFEYARQALRYRVKEYIVKTSVLEQLPDAIQRVCREIEEEQKSILSREREDFFMTLLRGEYNQQKQPETFQRIYKEYTMGSKDYQLVLIHNPSGIQKLPLKKVFHSWTYAVWSVDAVESCVLFYDSLPSGRDLMAACESLVSLTSGFYQNLAMFCISGQFHELGALPGVYASCRIMTDELFYEDARHVFFVEEWPRKKGLPSNLYESLDIILEKMAWGDRDGARNAAGELMRACENESINTIKSVGIFLLVESIHMILKVNDAFPRTFIDVEIQDDIYNCRSIAEFRKIVENMIDQVICIIGKDQDETDLLIHQANEYIADNYCRRLSLNDIAGELHVNRSYLSRKYKEQTGRNIFDVINTKRLQKAQQLLSSGNLRLHEVGEYVGFDDPTYFSRFFKKKTGMSPKEYKRANYGKDREDL